MAAAIIMSVVGNVSQHNEAAPSQNCEICVHPQLLLSESTFCTALASRNLKCVWKGFLNANMRSDDLSYLWNKEIALLNRIEL
mgnify:CR=1 FL=1